MLNPIPDVGQLSWRSEWFLPVENFRDKRTWICRAQIYHPPHAQTVAARTDERYSRVDSFVCCMSRVIIFVNMLSLPLMKGWKLLLSRGWDWNLTVVMTDKNSNLSKDRHN